MGIFFKTQMSLPLAMEYVERAGAHHVSAGLLHRCFEMGLYTVVVGVVFVCHVLAASFG